MSGRETIRLPGVAAAEDADRSAGAATAAGDITQQMLETSVWTDQLVAGAGIPILDSPLVTIGGGIGSFILADFLRIAGLPTSAIRSLGTSAVPWETYEYLTRVSQISRGERLRSDSGSTPDNIWGFPSYALREAFEEKGLSNKIAPLFQVGTEPILTDYYTPRAGQVFASMEKEAARISWRNMHVRGLVRVVRKRVGGGYFSILTPPDVTSPTKRIAYRSTHVHIAVGYPGLRFLPDLQEYRQKYSDFSRVVNAYEPHEHVYEELVRHPATVVVRGGGIVASRVLQRLIDDINSKGAQTTILHLFRTYVDSSHGPNIFMRRKGANGWAYQGFNWPKGGWGGQIKSAVEKAEGDDRKRFYQVMGGTNTPRRKLWLDQLADGRAKGYYKTFIGEVQDVTPGPHNQIITRIQSKEGILELPASYIIDGTGLEADISEHRLLNDLLLHSGVGRNVMGRLDVERSFEIRGMRSDPGRAYASGTATLGGYYLGVDSFLGLQYAALRITDDLAGVGFCKRIGPIRSISHWWKWARGKAI
jgi:hypothetical protein